MVSRLLFFPLLHLYALELNGHHYNTPVWMHGHTDWGNVSGVLIWSQLDPCISMPSEARSAIVLVTWSKFHCSFDTILASADAVGAKGVIVEPRFQKYVQMEAPSPSGLYATFMWQTEFKGPKIPLVCIHPNDGLEVKHQILQHRNRTFGGVYNVRFQAVLRESDTNPWMLGLFKRSYYILTFRALIPLCNSALSLWALIYLQHTWSSPRKASMLAHYALTVCFLFNLERAIFFFLNGNRCGQFLTEWLFRALYHLPIPWLWSCTMLIALTWHSSEQERSLTHQRMENAQVFNNTQLCFLRFIVVMMGAELVVLLLNQSNSYTTGPASYLLLSAVRGRLRYQLTIAFLLVRVVMQLLMLLLWVYQGQRTRQRLRDVSTYPKKNAPERFVNRDAQEKLSRLSKLLLLTSLGLLLHLATQCSATAYTGPWTFQHYFAGFLSLEVSNMLINLGVILFFSPQDRPGKSRVGPAAMIEIHNNGGGGGVAGGAGEARRSSRSKERMAARLSANMRGDLYIPLLNGGRPRGEERRGLAGGAGATADQKQWQEGAGLGMDTVERSSRREGYGKSLPGWPGRSDEITSTSGTE